MPNDTTTRWTIRVARDTDTAVRSFLAQRGMKQRHLAKFIEDAVKWRLLDQTTAAARDTFADLPLAAFATLLDEAVAAARNLNPPPPPNPHVH